MVQINSITDLFSDSGLLINGGFEGPEDIWAVSSTGASKAIVDGASGNPAYQGSRYLEVQVQPISSSTDLRFAASE
jgi:hypothetical protein